MQLTEKQIKALIAVVYEIRRDRKVNPDGKFDSSGRWYPSAAEDVDNVALTHRSPSRAWPYSYMTACRTRRHSRALVEAALDGAKVPADVAEACFAFVEVQS